MEISLDVPFIQRILAQEYARATQEIREAGVMPAFENSQQRHDERIAAAPDVNTLACGAGCAWCCHFSVDVRAVEVFRILDFVERELPASEQTRIHAEIRANSVALKNLDDMDRMRRNVRCPFLNASEGRCTIYTARPQTCRNYHATDVAGCQQSYEDPDNFDIDPEFAPYVYQSGAAHVDAFTAAMKDAGYDTNVYELNSALDAAMSDLQSRERFKARQAPFVDLDGDEVPPAFEDLES